MRLGRFYAHLRLLLKYEGLALLDTGSLVSIGRGAEYQTASQSVNPPTGIQSVPDAADHHIGREVQ
jgi:hypothetical protein